MSDRIAVMNQGRFEQIGTPDEIYNHPQTSYVATFVGNANILQGTVEKTEATRAQVCLCCGSAMVETGVEHPGVGEKVTLAIRSENIRLEESGSIGMKAVVREKSFAAGQLRVTLGLPDGSELIASRYGIDANVSVGQNVCWDFRPEDAVLVDWDVCGNHSEEVSHA